MKLKTSFFEPTILKKDITRFAPIWALYTLFSLLVVLLLGESDPEPARFANNASEIFLSMGVVNFIYAPLAALFLFGDLFKSRMCNALHALPLRREGWFLTHLTAGLLFCLVPNSLSALLTAGLLGEYAWMAALWLGLMLLQYIFFFGVATFACYCSGNALGALAIYGIVNFLSTIVGWFAVTFYEPLLYGVKLDFYRFAKYSPVVRFSNANYLKTYYDNMTGSLNFEGFIAADWRYLAIAGGVGVVFLVLALLIYRVRQLESAGDLIAFKPAAPVFLVLFTFLAGTVFYFIASLTGPALQYIFLVIGMAVGFFTGRMLLERKVKVFRGKSFLAFGILVVVFYASLGITALDPVGITRYMPEAGKIAYVQVGASHYMYDVNNNCVLLTDPANIQAVMEVHQDCIENPVGQTASYQSDYMPLYIRYEMKNGTYTERYYYVNTQGENADILQGFFSSEQAIFGPQGADYVLEKLRMIEVYDYNIDMPPLAVATYTDYLDIDYYNDKYGDSGKCLAYTVDVPSQDKVLQGLFEALKKDCGTGKLARSGMVYDQESWGHITLKYSAGPYVEYLDIEIFVGAENTFAYLKSLRPEDVPTPAEP